MNSHLQTILVSAALALASTTAAAQALEISAPAELHASASGLAVLDLVEGRKALAVISVPYPQALAAAHLQAGTAGRRIAVPSDLVLHPIDGSPGAGPRLTVATLGAPSEEALHVIEFLRARGARADFR